MSHQFTLIKRAFEDNAIIVFVDLLGTCALSENATTESQAEKFLYALISEFDIEFSEHFAEEEIKNNFDVSIFADSITINQRIPTANVIERLAKFLLSYQINILLNQKIQSRAIITIGPFFSFKICRDNTSSMSILSSEFTNIGLCGGAGVIRADKELVGLPLGVYIAEELMVRLSVDQQRALIPVEGRRVFFLKQTGDNLFAPFLTENALDNLLTSKNISENDISTAINGSYSDKALKKIYPWILANISKLEQIPVNAKN